MPKLSKKAEESKDKAILSAGCLALFALPFSAVALYMAWELGSLFWLAAEVKSWEKVPAELQTVELKTFDSDNSKTYQVLATYRYQHQGVAYDGDRVGLSSTADNFEGYHRKLHKRLVTSKEEGRPVDCYVDPNDPERAILDRSLRPVVVAFHVPFVVGFGAVGFGMLWGAWYAGRVASNENEQREVDPETPWLRRKDWRTGVVQSSNKAAMLAIGFFTLLWNSISLPLAVILLAGLITGDNVPPWWVVPIVLLFPLVGVGLLVWFFVLVVRWRRYGESSFRMATVPGVVGGELAGVVIAPEAVSKSDGVRVVLVCCRTVESGDSSREEILWQDERVIERTLDAGDPGRTGVPIVFAIPSEARATDDEAGVEWKLRVKAKVPGADYSAEFAVPVFRTEDSRPGVDADAITLSEFERDRPLEQLLAEEGILVEPLGSIGAVRYVSPPGRSKAAKWPLTLFTIVWSAIAIGITYNGLWVIGAGFLLISTVLLLVTLNLWLGCSELTITPTRWRSRNGWYGFRGAGIDFSPDKIATIETSQAMSSNSGSEQTVWNNVVAELHEDQQVVLMRNLKNRQAERKLLADLRERAGLKGSPTTLEVDSRS